MVLTYTGIVFYEITSNKGSIFIYNEDNNNNLPIIPRYGSVYTSSSNSIYLSPLTGGVAVWKSTFLRCAGLRFGARRYGPLCTDCAAMHRT